MARDLAIDLGTANTLVYERGRGIVLNEPTVIALNTRTREVLAMGHDAWQMIGRTPSDIVAERPLRQGAITDFDVTQRMIRLLLHRVRRRPLQPAPGRGVRARRPSPRSSGGRSPRPPAGPAPPTPSSSSSPWRPPSGAGLPIHEPVANLVIDVGGGTTETALISLGGVVGARRRAGRQLRLRRRHPGLRAPRVRHRRRRAHRRGDQGRHRVGLAGARRAQGRGAGPRPGMRACRRRSSSRRPRSARRIDDAVVEIVESVIACLGSAPPELAHDLITQGMYLVGGGGMLAGLDQRIAHDTEIDVHLVENAARVRGPRRRPLHRGPGGPPGRLPGRSAASTRFRRTTSVSQASAPDARDVRHPADRRRPPGARSTTGASSRSTSWPRWPRCPTTTSPPWPTRPTRCGWRGAATTVEVEGILSAKTGGCPEDCHFCSQSSKFDSPVQGRAAALATTRCCAPPARPPSSGRSEFCLVYAVRGPDERLMTHLEEIVPAGRARDRPATWP